MELVKNLFGLIKDPESLAINTVRVPKLIDFSTVEGSNFSYHETTSLLKSWLLEYIDLADFEFVYPLDGATQGILYSFLKTNEVIGAIDSDYSFVHTLGNCRKISSMEELIQLQHLYISCPYFGTGNFINLQELDNFQNLKSIILDVTWLGTTKIQKMEIPFNVEQVIFSFSKNFGLSQERLGWLFSKKTIGSADKYLSAGYYNKKIISTTMHIIKKYEPNYIYNLLNERNSQICDQLGIARSDSCLVGRKDLKFAKRSLTPIYFPDQSSGE